jgi:type I restriction enzyme S subunit
MSGLNFLERLLDGAEVEWKPLGEVAKYEQPTKYLVQSTNYSDDFVTPVLTAGKTFILGYTDEVNGIYRASKTPVIIFDDFTTANKWVDFDFKAKSSAMKMITSANDSKFILKYVYHWLNTLPSELIDGDHKRQWISNFCNKKIPIPPLKIQAEIVRILDTFTALTAELTAELSDRQKQYNYYRDRLLTFEDGEVEWKTLGEITRIFSASRVHKNEWTTSGVPFYRTSDVISIFNGVKNSRDAAFISNELYETLSSKSGKIQKNDILVTGGGTIGIPYIVPTDEPLYFKDADLLCIKKSKTLNSKFLYSNPK